MGFQAKDMGGPAATAGLSPIHKGNSRIWTLSKMTRRLYLVEHDMDKEDEEDEVSSFLRQLFKGCWSSGNTWTTSSLLSSSSDVVDVNEDSWCCCTGHCAFDSCGSV